jgi:hypothetical protein
VRKTTRRAVATMAVASVALSIAVGGTATATAYQPSSTALYTATDPGSCNKSPCILYPKSAQLPSGRLVAAFEDSQGPVIGQDMPIYKSDDYGDTWHKLADLKAPAYVSSDPAYAPYTSNWTNPFFYVLPEALGAHPAGTLLLANVASPGTATNNDRLASAIFLWASTDQGASWEIISKVVASPLTYNGVAGDTVWQDPTWEPYLMMRNGKLVVYYSDERDALGYNSTTGVVQFDSADSSSADSGGQILAHMTWDGVGAWTAPVLDVAGLTEQHDGKTKIGGGRPGMTNIVPTTDGKWLLTYEYWGGGDNNRFKIGTDPEKFFEVGGAAGTNISALPVAPGSQPLAQGGSPVLTTRPDGSIVYNAAGSSSVWVNESGRSDGVWKQYQTSVPAGYSRNLQYVEGTGRIHILQAPWGTGPVSHASLDLGHSEGAYYSLVNRQTGEVLSTAANKTQDVNLTGDQPDIITWSNDATNDTQRWHVQPKGSSVTFLNKAGGRALGIFWGNASAGQPIVQWVDDGGSDKLWKLVSSTDGHVKIQSTLNASLYMTGAGSGGTVTVSNAISTAGGAAADDAQEWLLVQEAPTSGLLSADRVSNPLVAVDSAARGQSLALNAAVADPANALTNASKTGRAWALDGTGSAVELGAVQFDAQEKASLTLPETTPLGTGVKIAVQFDSSATIWDAVEIVDGQAPTIPATADATTRCASGKVTLTVSATNQSTVTTRIEVDTPYGRKVFASVAAGRTISSAFSTRVASIPAGEAAVTVSGTVDGSPVTNNLVAPYPATSC